MIDFIGYKYPKGVILYAGFLYVRFPVVSVLCSESKTQKSQHFITQPIAQATS